jgi:hypothetical protein
VAFALLAACGGSANNQPPQGDTALSPGDGDSSGDSTGDNGDLGPGDTTIVPTPPTAVIVGLPETFLDIDGNCSDDFVLDGTQSSDAQDPASSLAYLWESSPTPDIFDDPTSSTPTASIPNGTTIITLTVTDSDGMSATVQNSIQVSSEHILTSQDQDLTMPLDTGLHITLTAADTQNGDLNFVILTPPENGTLSAPISLPGTPVVSASLTYTPNSGFSGADSFTFVAQLACRQTDTHVVRLGINSRLIQGAISHHDSTLLTDVPVVLTGTGAAAGVNLETATNNEGFYWVAVPMGWEGDIASDVNYRLNPALRAFTPLLALTAAQDFTAYRNYYVDQDHPLATNDGPGTEEIPFFTMRGPPQIIDVGSTVFVKAGTYVVSENRGVEAWGKGTAEQPIIYQEYPGHEVIMDVTDVQDGFHVVAAHHNIISGFEVFGGHRDGVRAQDAKDLVVEDLTVHTFRGGFETSAIRCRLECDNVIFRRNHVYDSNRGIVIGNIMTNVTVEDNYVHDIHAINHKDVFIGDESAIGIALSGVDGAIVRGNVVIAAGESGIAVTDSLSVVVDGNVVLNSGGVLSGPGNPADTFGHGIRVEDNTGAVVTRNVNFNNHIGFYGTWDSFTHNTSYGNQTLGVSLQSSPPSVTVLLRNNIAESITVDPGASIDSDYNLWVDGAFPYGVGNIVEGINSLSGDPLYEAAPAITGAPIDAVAAGFEVDIYDPNFGDASVFFELLVSSPAVNTGADLGNGHNGAAPEMGAFESP